MGHPGSAPHLKGRKQRGWHGISQMYTPPERLRVSSSSPGQDGENSGPAAIVPSSINQTHVWHQIHPRGASSPPGLTGRCLCCYRFISPSLGKAPPAQLHLCQITSGTFLSFTRTEIPNIAGLQRCFTLDLPVSTIARDFLFFSHPPPGLRCSLDSLIVLLVDK